MMNRRKWFGIFGLGISLCFAMCPCLGMNAVTEGTAPYSVAQAEERGLFTSIGLYMEGGNGVIRAWAKNLFTLFPAVVRLDVELYSSETYENTYTKMKLEKRASIADLDQGHILEVTASTNGEQKYWRARVYYNMDQGEWKSQETDTLLYSPEGEVIR